MARKRKINPEIPEGNKRVMINVPTETWERLQALAKEVGMPPGWLSAQISQFLPGLLIVAEQAKKDAEARLQLSETQAKKRYEKLFWDLLKKNEEKM